MSSRILLVEDDPALLAMLQAAVSYGGFASTSVSRGDDALRALQGGGLDAVLLDLGLPDCDGGELLEQLRSSSDLPIIVVSGRGSEADKIHALDLGADDYVAKPFLPGELLARIRAALRRSGRSDEPDAEPPPFADRLPTRYGALTLDPFDLSASLHGLKVVLGGPEFRLLRALADAGGETLSRADLLASLYGAEVSLETNIADVYMSRLRRKLAGLHSGTELIANVRGRGWRLSLSD